MRFTWWFILKMIINKVIKSLAKNITGDVKIKPTLASVFFDKNKASATDATKLVEIEFIEDYKNICVIDKEVIKKLDNETYYIENLNWEIFIKNENTTIKANDLWASRFPEYEKFFNNDWTLEIWFDVDYMINILQVYKTANIKTVKMTLWDPLQPILLSSYDNNKDFWIKSIRSILMPVRIKNYE